jgi:preprotein translocase subunit YajC
MTFPIATLSNLILAETASAPSGPQSIFGNQFIMIGLMLVMFYFLLIRPQQQQRKEMAARIAALQAGDKVVTSAGLHGIVHHIKENTVIIKVAEGTMLEFDKTAVAHVHKKDVPSK